MKITRLEGTTTVAVTFAPIERVLLQSGSERTAIDTARKLWPNIDRATARLVVRAAREGVET